MTLSVCVSVTASTTRPRWPRGRSKSRFTLPDKYNRSSQERVPTVHRTGNRKKNCITHVRHAVIKHTLAYSINRKGNCISVGAPETAPVRFLRSHLSVSWPPPIATRASRRHGHSHRSLHVLRLLFIVMFVGTYTAADVSLLGSRERSTPRDGLALEIPTELPEMDWL